VKTMFKLFLVVSIVSILSTNMALAGGDGTEVIGKWVHQNLSVEISKEDNLFIFNEGGMLYPATFKDDLFIVYGIGAQFGVGYFKTGDYIIFAGKKYTRATTK